VSRAEEDYPENTNRFDWHVPSHARVLPYAMIAAMTAIWVQHFLADRIALWGLSAKALAAGHYENIALHMIAHGPIFHIAMNMIALYEIGPKLVARLGPPVRAAAAFLILFFLSGLSGAALFLALHPHGTVPMVGASGALYGLLGMLLRLPPQDGDIAPMDRQHAWRLAKDFVKDNGWLFVMLTLPNILMGREGGLAWEAHLGGLLFGLIAAPLFFRGARADLEALRLAPHPDAS